MSRNYDNWERLVSAVLRKEQLWQLFYAQSRSPSILSEASGFISSVHSSSVLQDVALGFSKSASPSTYRQQIENGVVKLLIQLPKRVLVSGFPLAFNVGDVVLSSAEFLGRGTFGSTYMVAMENGTKIVVKRLMPMDIAEANFNLQMEFVRNVRHQNVAALRTYYFSEGERFMLYDYYSNGSVFALLHGQTGENPIHVDWATRLRIAIGTARGTAKIHTQNGGKLVHGNIKSSNIFLNAQQYGCVSDLGVANMAASPFRIMSQASDVYSFGILLFELLTRKSPVQVPGGPEAIDLVKLVSSVKGKDMTAKLLEDIRIINTVTSVSSESKLVFVADENPKFDLEEMLRSSGQILGHGTFGTAYMVTFDNGDTIMVRRFRDVIPFWELEQHMEIIGRIRHGHVAKLRAYVIKKEEALLGRTQGRTSLGKVVSIVDWIQSLSPNDWTAKVIDHRLRHRHAEAMVQVLQIGMDCAAAVPQHRPKMPQVVRMLEEISGTEPSNESRGEDGLKQTCIESILGDGLEHTSSESSLEDLLEYGFLSPVIPYR
ncbi:UNVERIFIED_CONTAM: putative inactive receptor kinase [Sesamum radiatum]|uniref:Inactive receptor kinase n=1 Tax=Sesamum radiatum TaxID=300843 RepID=A0AAW2JVR4_SESRA